jgi:hypothetical protein
MKSVFEFTIVLNGITRFSAATEDALFRSGCDDALPVVANRVAQLDFAREAASLSEAILSAIEDVHRAKTGATVTRVEMAPEALAIASKHLKRKLKANNGTMRRAIARNRIYKR